MIFLIKIACSGFCYYKEETKNIEQQQQQQKGKKRKEKNI